MKKLNVREADVFRFENFLWKHHNPSEVLEEWAQDVTAAIAHLSVVSGIDPCDIDLPLSDAVLDYVRNAHEFFRIPLSDRDPNEILTDFYPGDALSDDELRWVARHIQGCIIPAV